MQPATIRLVGRLPLALLTLSIIPGGLRAQPTRYEPDGGYYFTYRDEARTLRLSSDEIWVRARDESLLADDVIEAQAPGWRRTLSRGDWVLFTTPNASDPPIAAPRAKPAASPAKGAVNRLIDTLQNVVWVSPTFVDQDGFQLTFPAELTVRLQPKVSSKAAIELFDEAGFVVLREGLGTLRNTWILEGVDWESAFDVLVSSNDLSTRPEVLWAEPNFHVWNARPLGECAPIVGNMPVSNYWPLEGTWGINIEPAWDLCGGANAANNAVVRIAVVDEGIDLDHVDLDTEDGRNFAAESGGAPTGPTSDAGHIHDEDRYSSSDPEKTARDTERRWLALLRC